MVNFSLPSNKIYSYEYRTNWCLLLIYTLCRHMRYRTAFEIGVHTGLTFKVLSNCCTTVHGIDISLKKLSKEIIELERYNDEILIQEIDSANFQPYNVGTWDFINVDGDHSYDGALRDLRIASKLLDVSNGTIMVDDALAREEISCALNDFLKENNDFLPFMADEQAVYIHHRSSNKVDFLDTILLDVFGQFCYINDMTISDTTIPKLSCLPVITNTNNEVLATIIKNL